MAELAASIIGIMSVGTKVTLVLSQVASDAGSAGKEARMISSEIQSFCLVVQTLEEALQQVQTSQYYAHCRDTVCKTRSGSTVPFANEFYRVGQGYD